MLAMMATCRLLYSHKINSDMVYVVTKRYTELQK